MPACAANVEATTPAWACGEDGKRAVGRRPDGQHAADVARRAEREHDRGP